MQPIKNHRFWKFLSEKGWLWLMLLSFSAIFLFPFIWMLVSSIKTDEDVSQGQFLPAMPEFRAQSPYVIEANALEKPANCSVVCWQRLLPDFTAHTSQLVRQDPGRPQLLASDDADEKMIEQASQFLVTRGIQKMPHQVWLSSSDEELKMTFQNALRAGGGIQAELIKAYSKTHARMIIHGVKVRSRGVGIIYQSKFDRKTPEKNLPEGLSAHEGKTGELLYDSDGMLVLRTQFASSSDAPAVITYRFRIDRPQDEIFRIIVPMSYDGSWHQLDARVNINGIDYTGTRTTALAQNRSSALTLQIDGNDEKEWGKRPWVVMKKSSLAAPPAATPQAQKNISDITLTLTLRPSSTTAARVAKVKRNYQRVFLSMPFWKYVINSILITVLSIFGAVASSCFVAYAFARLKWPGRSIAFVVLLSTMMLPPQVTMIPQFLIWREIGWYNTLNPIWVPTWFGVAFFIFLMVQQMKSIPRDLEEAAEIDGMNRLQTWWYVIVPLVKPAMAAIAIMSFMGSWNEFMSPLIYLRDMDRFPLSVGIYAMGADETMAHDMSLILAGNLLMTFPVIIIFFIFQRYFIQGVSSAGVKG